MDGPSGSQNSRQFAVLGYVEAEMFERVTRELIA